MRCTNPCASIATRPVCQVSGPMQSTVIRGRRRLALALAAVLAVGLVIGYLLSRGGGGGLAPGRGPSNDPLAYRPGAEERLASRAAAGLSHVLYAKSPDGATATAARAGRFRPVIEATARRYGEDPDMLEAIVFLESAGRPEARAGNDLRGAVGLTQILAQTGQGLLHMHVDLPRSIRLTEQIGRAFAKGRRGQVARLRAQRRRADQRFDPAKSLAATCRYLRFAKEKLGRDDLAVESYHMGVGNLQGALAAYGGGEVSYVALYFGSPPLRHPRAFRPLAGVRPARGAGRRLGHLPVAGPGGAGDHAALPQRPPRAAAATGPARAQGDRGGGAPPARFDSDLRVPGRGRPGARERRAAAAALERSRAAPADRPGPGRARTEAPPPARALPRAAAGGARDSDLHRGGRARDQRGGPADGHERRARPALPSSAREGKRAGHARLLPPHDGLRVRHPAALQEPRAGGRLPVHARPADRAEPDLLGGRAVGDPHHGLVGRAAAAAAAGPDQIAGSRGTATRIGTPTAGRYQSSHAGLGADRR